MVCARFCSAELSSAEVLSQRICTAWYASEPCRPTRRPGPQASPCPRRAGRRWWPRIPGSHRLRLQFLRSSIAVQSSSFSVSVGRLLVRGASRTTASRPGPRRSRCTAHRRCGCCSRCRSAPGSAALRRLVETDERCLRGRARLAVPLAASAPAVDSTCPMTPLSSPEIRSKLLPPWRGQQRRYSLPCWIPFSLPVSSPREWRVFRPASREVCRRTIYQSSSSSSSRSWGRTRGAVSPALLNRRSCRAGPSHSHRAATATPPTGASPVAASSGRGTAPPRPATPSARASRRSGWTSAACAPACHRRPAATPRGPGPRPTRHRIHRPADDSTAGWHRSVRPGPCRRPNAAHLAEHRRHLLQRLGQLLHRLHDHLAGLLRKLADRRTQLRRHLHAHLHALLHWPWLPACWAAVVGLLRPGPRRAAAAMLPVPTARPACRPADSTVAWAPTCANAASRNAAAGAIAAASARSPSPRRPHRPRDHDRLHRRDRLEHRVQHVSAW